MIGVVKAYTLELNELGNLKGPHNGLIPDPSAPWMLEYLFWKCGRGDMEGLVQLQNPYLLSPRSHGKK